MFSKQVYNLLPSSLWNLYQYDYYEQKNCSHHYPYLVPAHFSHIAISLVLLHSLFPTCRGIARIFFKGGAQSRLAGQTISPAGWMFVLTSLTTLSILFWKLHIRIFRLILQKRNIVPLCHLHVITILIIRLFRIQYKTRIAEACDYYRNSTLDDEIARWTK